MNWSPIAAAVLTITQASSGSTMTLVGGNIQTTKAGNPERIRLVVLLKSPSVIRDAWLYMVADSGRITPYRLKRRSDLNFEVTLPYISAVNCYAAIKSDSGVVMYVGGPREPIKVDPSGLPHVVERKDRALLTTVLLVILALASSGIIKAK